LLDASDRPPQELDSSLPYPAPENRLLVRKARELLFQAFSEGRLTLWARTIRPVLEGGPIELPVPPLPISMGQNGHLRTGYWKGMGLISLGHIAPNNEGQIIRDLAAARDKVLDKMAFAAWLDGVFSKETAKSARLKPTNNNQIVSALRLIIHEVVKNKWPYLTITEVEELMPPEFESVGRHAQRDRIRALFRNAERPKDWIFKGGPRKVNPSEKQLDQLRHKLREKLRELFPSA
jgi:hypothetical protein